MMEFRQVQEDARGNPVSEITYTLDSDSGLHEVMQAFRLFLLGVSFHPDSVEKYIEAE